MFLFSKCIRSIAKHLPCGVPPSTQLSTSKSPRNPMVQWLYHHFPDTEAIASEHEKPCHPLLGYVPLHRTSPDFTLLRPRVIINSTMMRALGGHSILSFVVFVDSLAKLAQFFQFITCSWEIWETHPIFQ